ncbi:RING finger protein 157 [Babesia caballi]|uniref:RING finger protein 157 n=1 Tax=Babesia caballi TaxID=5871 RepID=A0AAV4LRJ9_BABCB|nr:RING finger protein 157 [Babesia caballi]
MHHRAEAAPPRQGERAGVPRFRAAATYHHEPRRRRHHGESRLVRRHLPQLAMSAGMHSPDTDRPVVAIGSTSVDGVRPVDTAIAVPRSSIALEQVRRQSRLPHPHQLDDSRFTVSFTYTAGSPATVSFLFQQKHQGLKNGVPSFSPPKLKLGPFDLPVGDKLKYRLDPAEARRHPQLTLDFCAFRSEHAFVPLLLLLESPANDYTLFVMAGLAFNDASGRWDLVVTKQRVRRGATGYELQEVYGLRSSALGRAGAPAGGDAQDAQDDRDCRCHRRQRSQPAPRALASPLLGLDPPHHVPGGDHGAAGVAHHDGVVREQRHDAGDGRAPEVGEDVPVVVRLVAGAGVELDVVEQVQQERPRYLRARDPLQPPDDERPLHGAHEEQAHLVVPLVDAHGRYEARVAGDDGGGQGLEQRVAARVPHVHPDVAVDHQRDLEHGGEVDARHPLPARVNVKVAARLALQRVHRDVLLAAARGDLEDREGPVPVAHPHVVDDRMHLEAGDVGRGLAQWDGESDAAARRRLVVLVLAQVGVPPGRRLALPPHRVVYHVEQPHRGQLHHEQVPELVPDDEHARVRLEGLDQLERVDLELVGRPHRLLVHVQVAQLLLRVLRPPVVVQRVQRHHPLEAVQPVHDHLAALRAAHGALADPDHVPVRHRRDCVGRAARVLHELAVEGVALHRVRRLHDQRAVVRPLRPPEVQLHRRPLPRRLGRRFVGRAPAGVAEGLRERVDLLHEALDGAPLLALVRLSDSQVDALLVAHEPHRREGAAALPGVFPLAPGVSARAA